MKMKYRVIEFNILPSLCFMTCFVRHYQETWNNRSPVRSVTKKKNSLLKFKKEIGALLRVEGTKKKLVGLVRPV